MEGVAGLLPFRQHPSYSCFSPFPTKSVHSGVLEKIKKNLLVIDLVCYVFRHEVTSSNSLIVCFFGHVPLVYVAWVWYAA